jgi:ubiquinone/menaquinone biosynthesis C-methylase UbiE
MSDTLSRLNVGAGDTEWGDVRLDIGHTSSVTVLGDMHALPFTTDTFDEVLLDNVLEHTSETTAVLSEVHRVLRPGGVAYVFVPYYNAVGAYMDPTHRSFFSEGTFEYFSTSSRYAHYSEFEFEGDSEEFYHSILTKYIPSKRVRLKLGHFFGGLTLAMKVVLRKPGPNPVSPTIEGWL